jgi:hypothetical protein
LGAAWTRARVEATRALMTRRQNTPASKLGLCHSCGQGPAASRSRSWESNRRWVRRLSCAQMRKAVKMGRNGMRVERSNGRRIEGCRVIGDAQCVALDFGWVLVG